MLVLQIIIACVLYAIIAGITCFMANKLIKDFEDGSVVVSVFWPIALPVLLIVSIALETVKFLKWTENKIKSKRK